MAAAIAVGIALPRLPARLPPPQATEVVESFQTGEHDSWPLRAFGWVFALDEVEPGG